MDIFIEKFYKDFQQYTFKNKVLASASGFAFGFATNEFLANLLNEVLLPAVNNVVKTFVAISPIPDKYPMLWSGIQSLSKILWLFFVWITTILISFFLIEYILNRKIIGMTSNVIGDEKQEYIETKAESEKKNNILPTEIDKIDIEIEKQETDKVKYNKEGYHSMLTK